MRLSVVVASVTAVLCGAAAAPVPAEAPYFIPYGVPISMEMAKKAVDAAHAEAVRRGWKMAIPVVSPAGDLTYFFKMDDTQLASADIAPRKARTAARFRRDTQIFFEQIETGHP